MEYIGQKVNSIFKDSLFKEDELVDGKPNTEPVVADGVLRSFGFHKERLESHKAELKEIIDEMNPTFKESVGGGWSFLNLCEDKNGNLWGQHQDVEQLVALSVGLGMGSYVLPREYWPLMPGGMPYIVFKD